MVWSVHVSKSTHPRIDRTLSVRRIVMWCFRLDESPKFGIVLRSSNRRSRDRRNRVVPESKPNPASLQLYFENEAFFSISYQNVFFSTLSWFRRFVVWSVRVSHVIPMSFCKAEVQSNHKHTWLIFHQKHKCLLFCSFQNISSRK